MNFTEIVKRCLEGKKGHLELGWYMAYESDKLVFRRTINNGLTQIQGLQKENVDANNWEIYEEKDTWNLAEQRAKPPLIEEGASSFDIDDIKTFIQKVKEDMSNIPDDVFCFQEVCDKIDKRSGKL